MAALLLSVIRAPFVAFDPTTYVRVAYRHLAVSRSGSQARVRQHVDTHPQLRSPLAADHQLTFRQNAHEITGRTPTR